MKKTYMTKPLVVSSIAILCCLLWGSAVTTIKTGYRLMGVESSDIAAQILFAGMRFTLAGIMVILFACVMNRRLILPTKNIMKYASVLCLAQTVGQYFFFYIGVANTSGVKSSIITGLGNFIAIFASCFVFRREKMTSKKMFGCMLGIAGVVLINVMGNELDLQMSVMGEGFLLIAQVAYALSTVMIGIFSSKESPVVLSGYQFFIGGCVLMAIGVLMGGHIPKFPLAAVGILIYLAFVSATAYSLWSVLLAYNPVSKVAIYGFVNPLFGVILAALVLGETRQAFNSASLIALALVCVGIYIVNRPDKIEQGKKG